MTFDLSRWKELLAGPSPYKGFLTTSQAANRFVKKEQDEAEKLHELGKADEHHLMPKYYIFYNIQ